jgi:NTP pyrophosphatase (non-canonical NTP hydrolase)
MRISELVETAHADASAKGFVDNAVEADLMLMVSELAEALEEYRTHGDLGHVYKRDDGKPEGYVYELADVVIRIAHHCGRHGLPLERVIVEKLAFNRSRPFKHGRRF